MAGHPVVAWPPAVLREEFTPSFGRGTQRLISAQDTGHCPSCGHAVRLRLDGRIVAHKNEAAHCPGSDEPATELRRWPAGYR